MTVPHTPSEAVFRVILWWDHVAWVAVDYERWFAQQGPTPATALGAFRTSVRALARHYNVPIAEALHAIPDTPERIRKRFEDARPLLSLVTAHGIVAAGGDKTMTYVTELTVRSE